MSMEISEGFEIARYECPTCHARLTGAFHVGTEEKGDPEPGSIGVCVYCLGCHQWETVEKAHPIRFSEMLKMVSSSNKRAQIAKAYCAIADLHAEWVRTGKIKLTADAIPPIQ